MRLRSTVLVVAMLLAVPGAVWAGYHPRAASGSVAGPHAHGGFSLGTLSRVASTAPADTSASCDRPLCGLRGGLYEIR